MYRSAKITRYDALIMQFFSILKLRAEVVWQYCIPFEGCVSMSFQELQLKLGRSTAI
jgi:hypothetical protein